MRVGGCSVPIEVLLWMRAGGRTRVTWAADNGHVLGACAESAARGASLAASLGPVNLLSGVGGAYMKTADR